MLHHRTRARAAVRAAVLVSTVSALAACAAAPDMAEPACDRDCLAGMITAYVDALAAHDPALMPLAEDVRFTEDSQELPLGAGLWETVTEVGGFRQDYLDTEAQVAAAHVELFEADAQVLLSVALHVEDGAVAGIETIVQRITPESRFQPTMLGTPPANVNDPLTDDERLTRADAIATALTYTEGLRVGTFVDIAPFAEDAYRIENGVFMAGAGCPRESCPDIQTQDIIEHPDITASVVAVDEEMGLVLLWMNFGDTGSYGPDTALVTFESFKVSGSSAADGEIHAVNAFFGFLPDTTTRGWPSTDPIPMAHLAE